MPKGNGTGPAGYGPMTGRGLGFCAGFDVPGFANAGAGGGPWGGRQPYGRGFGRGMGRGYAWRNAGGYPQYSNEDEVQGLKNHAEYLKERLQDVEQRLHDMESGQSKE